MWLGLVLVWLTRTILSMDSYLLHFYCLPPFHTHTLPFSHTHTTHTALASLSLLPHTPPPFYATSNFLLLYNGKTAVCHALVWAHVCMQHIPFWRTWTYQHMVYASHRLCLWFVWHGQVPQAGFPGCSCDIFITGTCLPACVPWWKWDLKRKKTLVGTGARVGMLHCAGYLLPFTPYHVALYPYHPRPLAFTLYALFTHTHLFTLPARWRQACHAHTRKHSFPPPPPPTCLCGFCLLSHALHLFHVTRVIRLAGSPAHGWRHAFLPFSLLFCRYRHSSLCLLDSLCPSCSCCHFVVHHS